MSTRPQPSQRASPPPPGARTLERRLLGWLLALTVAPSLILLALGGWALAGSLDLTAAEPWEEVAETGRLLVDTVEPGDSAEAAVIARHREALSRSLTQARRWAFVGERLTQAMPWLVLVVALALVLLAYAATRQLAAQLAQPIEDLVVLADRLGREEPLPPPTARSTYEVRVLDETLRQAATELDQARDRALVAERLRVWGEMARRVAHEMKNPLTPLRFAAHRLGRLEDGPEPLAEMAEVIEQEVGRLEELAAQFRSLGRPPEGPATEIDLVELMGSLLSTDAPDTAWAVDAPPELPPVRGHYDALFRALRNLVRNALEAMEGDAEARIDVALRTVEVDGAEWVELRIRDYGPGLPPEGAKRIFEPDFTTKTRGTGLGLAVVQQAITGDGGTIVARNAETGAEFVVRLPVTDTLATPGKDAG